jgi:hypothetical protein
MAVYMIGYDIHPTKGETYDELTEAIKSVGSKWWHHLDSTWLVISNKTAAQIRDELWKHMKSDDQLLVMEHKPDAAAAWNGFNERGGTWLKTNL